MEKLEDITRINLKEDIESLEYGAGITKRRAKVLVISEELAGFVGAFIADGHLKERECNWGKRRAKHYELVFREEYESNMLVLSNWINSVFDVGVKPKKEKNHFSIYISNKIIFATNI